MQKQKPSRTAYKVALGVLALGTKPEMRRLLPPGIVEATTQLLLASKAVPSWAVRLACTRQMASFYQAFDWMLPGQFQAFAYRKAFFERNVREAIGTYATQVLVLGSGYDTLAWRLSREYAHIQFFEIDHPATARLKIQGIAEMGKGPNHFLMSEDLGKTKLVDVLEAKAPWSFKAPSIFLAEGLLMYLSPEAVRELFLQCHEASGADSRIAFSYIPSGASGRFDAGRFTGMMLWLQKVANEPWLWSIYPKELARFLKDVGWIYHPELSGTTEKHGVEFFISALKDSACATKGGLSTTG